MRSLVNFTREPIIESIITPKDSFKLVVRNSKGVGVEEYFVDSLEIVSFGPAIFYRSTEKPKAFLLPVSDYEVLEVRDTRLALKSVPLLPKTQKQEKESPPPASTPKEPKASTKEPTESRQDKKRRRTKRKKEREETEAVKEAHDPDEVSETQDIDTSVSKDSKPAKETKPVKENKTAKEPTPEKILPPPKNLRAMLAPPTMLIADTIAKYKDEEHDTNGKSSQTVSQEKQATSTDTINDESKFDLEAQHTTVSISESSSFQDDEVNIPSVSFSSSEQDTVLGEAKPVTKDETN